MQKLIWGAAFIIATLFLLSSLPKLINFNCPFWANCLISIAMGIFSYRFERPFKNIPLFVLFILICFIGILPYIHKTVPSTLKEYFCTNNRRDKIKDTDIIEPVLLGLEPSLFLKTRNYPSRYSLDEPLSKKEKLWEEAIKNGLRQLISEKALAWIGESKLSKKVQKLDIDAFSTRSMVPAPLINLASLEAYADCGTNEYVVDMTFYIVREPTNAIPEELRSLLENAAYEAWENKLDSLRAGKKVTLSLPGDIIAPIKNDSTLRDKIKTLLSDPNIAAILQVIPKEVGGFLQTAFGVSQSVYPFNTASYIPGDEMRLALKIISSRIPLIVKDLGQIEVTAIGFADSRKLRNKIEYKGGANLMLGQYERSFFRSNDVKDTKRFITTNCQLSIARGFEAAKVINKMLVNPKQKGIGVYYAGAGEVTGVPLDKNRRVELIIMRTGQK